MSFAHLHVHSEYRTAWLKANYPAEYHYDHWRPVTAILIARAGEGGP